MTLLAWIILFSLLGGVLSVGAAAAFLVIPQHVRDRLMPHLISFATGALLGAAFLALLPHALEKVGGDQVHRVTAAVLGGLLLFFALEKFVIWRHCHNHRCEGHSPDVSEATRRSPGTLILIGDGLHNFVDGILIGAAFLTDIPLGIVISLAVAAHEIPQELGDFVILLESGYNRMQALLLNIASSLATVAGALLAWFSLSGSSVALPYVVAVAVAGFLYIAVADLIPGLHRRTDLRDGVTQMLLIGIGIGVIAATETLLH
ncbi:MAG: ZIP family metal transporter [Chromatiales bacterium]